MKKTTFIILCLEGAVLSFNVAATAALVPSVAGDFALSQFVVGNIVWLYMLPYGLAALIYGPLIRVVDARRVELTCFFMFLCSNALAAFANNIAILFLARFLMGLFGASVIPLALILISEQIKTQNRGKFVGIFFGTTFLASLLGLFLSGIIPWRWIYLLPAITGLLVFAWMYKYFPSFSSGNKKIEFHYLRALRDKKVASIFLYIFVISLLYHGIQQWLGVYFSKDYSFSQFLISMLITLTSLSGIFGEVIGGHLSDRIGRVNTINIGIILMILSVLLVVFKMPVWIFAVLMITWGLGWTFNHAGLSTTLTDFPGEFLNEVASLNSGIRFVSGGLGVFIAGLVMQKSFYLGFLSFGLCFAILFLFSKKLLR